MNQSILTSDKRFFGSVIYKELGTDELCLNFVKAVTSSQIQGQKTEEEELELDYPQQPVSQSWIVDYPLLAYKTCTPMNKEIAIIHLSLNMPLRIIHLGQWEFICFVNHTQMIE